LVTNVAGKRRRTVTPKESIASAATGRKVLITCGAGGVGKTTVAAALGVAAVQRQPGRVLVLTIDPARRLATALGLKALGNTEVKVSVPGAEDGAELWVAMLDTSQSWDDLVRRHAPDAQTVDAILANPLYRNVTQRFIQSHDYIALERLHELSSSGRYDLIVIDTPPSRHALDFLDAPERMADFFSSPLLRWITMPYRVGGERAGRLGYLAAKPFYQVADRILGSAFLRDIGEFFLLFQSMYDGFVQRAKSVASLLHEPTTSFVVVSTLDPSPVAEAEFLLAELATRKLHRGALVLNRTLPTWLADTSMLALAERVAEQGATRAAPAVSDPVRRRVVEIAAQSALRNARLAVHEDTQRGRISDAPPVVVNLPEDSGDVTDVVGLTRLADYLWPKHHES
jgi:anion-transporting  ArsA/GET3 family ATPase